MKPRLINPEDARGYTSTVFEGKPAQMKEVINALASKNLIPIDRIAHEVEWFYNSLGIDESYFAYDSVENIASYILSLYSAKVNADSLPENEWDLRFQRILSDHAVFLDLSIPGESNTTGRNHFEDLIDSKYLSSSNLDKAYRLETFRCQDVMDRPNDHRQLRCYFVWQCDFPQKVSADEVNLEKISNRAFWHRASSHTKQLYQNLIHKAANRMGPISELYEVEGEDEARLVIAYRQQSSPKFFSALSHLYHYYGLTSSRKYVEQFANGFTVIGVYLKPAPFRKHSSSFKQAIYQVYNEISLLYSVPQSEFSEHLRRGELSLQEAIYAHCGLIFVSHFLNRLGPEYEALRDALDMSKSSNFELMNRLKQRLRGETFTREFIFELMTSRVDVLHELYKHFVQIHYVQGNRDAADQSWYSRAYNPGDLFSLIKQKAQDEHEKVVLDALLVFNENIMKTNFFTPTKTALSFRLEPKFLPTTEYPDPLYGMFLVVGQEFRGFHLRFRDVARGGIRIVKSRNHEVWSANARSLFDENYNLANTQQRKNKDIPEGGSKGVILLNEDSQHLATQAFEKYIDAIIDILIPGQTPGIKEAIVDLYGKEEILFMGPDENTAGLVDWATWHAKSRGAPWWKSFFTGKSPKVGGIPHDVYGMTSLSVREYVLGIYRKLKTGTVRKLQTGGPDGDLGSNEILLSTENEIYIAIVDGSGVIADPKGLDKSELRRLAKERVMISHYDTSKLSDEGYRVLVDEQNRTLPNGLHVDSGVTFRNTYHLSAAKLHSIDLFVPCGGRPAAIDISNVGELIDGGKSLISFIVEGANLFITQTAKLSLEKAGCIVFKDASANKGGVTSSSLEVLASLAFDDQGFFENMCVHGNEPPEFYRTYVNEVKERICENARLEFEAIWRDTNLTGEPRSILSDTLSISINRLGDEIVNSNLWDDEAFRNGILCRALPHVLVTELGIHKITKQVPEAYLRAVFASYLSGRYVYEHGIKANQFAFYEFMTRQKQALSLK